MIKEKYISAFHTLMKKRRLDGIRYDSSLIHSQFLKLMPAAILTMATPSINSIIDGLFASNYIGTDALSAIGLYSPFINVLIGISTIFLSGSLIITGLHLGRGEQKEANSVFATDIITTVAVLTAISFIMIFFSGAGAAILGAGEDTLANTASYIRGIAFSVPLVYLAGHLSSYLELEQQHTRNYAGIALMVVSNALFDYVFVSILDMGCLGLGMATTLSSAVYAFVLIIYYFSGKSHFRICLPEFDWAKIPEIVKIGFPGAIAQIYLAFRGYYINQTVMRFEGADGMAALSAACTFQTVFFAASYGIGISSRTLFSVFIGRKDRKSLQTVLKTALLKAFPVNIVLSTVFIFLAPVFTSVYFQDPASAPYILAIRLFRLFPIAMCISTVGLVFSSLYQCQQKMKIVNLISATDGLLGMVIAIMVLCPRMKIDGVWAAYVVNGLIVTLLILIYTILSSRKFPVSIDDWLLLGDDFGIAEDQRANFSVHNNEDVVNCSEKIISYLAAQGFDKRKSYLAGLCLEEMAGNIISHGYTKDKRNHNIVIEITRSEKDLLITMMDDCVEFDPVKRASSLVTDDPSKNIGIRTVQKIAAEMMYHRMVGMNVLTIRL